MKNKPFIIAILMIIGLLVTSCTVDLHPNAANSAPAIFAVVFEYIWAIIVLIVSLLFRFIFVTGVGLTFWSLFHLLLEGQTCNNYLLIILLCVGILGCMIGLIITPKINLPYIRISNKPLPAQPQYEYSICWKSKLYEGVVGLIFAIITEVIIRISF